MTRPDLIGQLLRTADDLGTVLLPASEQRGLDAVVRATRSALGSAAASIAALDEAEGSLRWLAADGEGATSIVGTVLPLGRGIAGFVASTGQSLIVDEVTRDPRFAADVAERTGYVPTSILAVPVVDERSEVIGVLSVLDRAGRGDDLAVASEMASVAAAILPIGRATRRLGSILLGALADAAEADIDLATALRRRASRDRAGNAELADLAAIFAELRVLGGTATGTALRLIEDFVDYAQRGRRR